MDSGLDLHEGEVRHCTPVRRMASAYLRAYRRQRAVEPAAVRRWDIPVAAARLADGIEEETTRLLALLEERRAKAPGT